MQAAADIESRALLALIIVSLCLDCIRIVFKTTPAPPNLFILNLWGSILQTHFHRCLILIASLWAFHDFKTTQDRDGASFQSCMRCFCHLNFSSVRPDCRCFVTIAESHCLTDGPIGIPCYASVLQSSQIFTSPQFASHRSRCFPLVSLMLCGVSIRCSEPLWSWPWPLKLFVHRCCGSNKIGLRWLRWPRSSNMLEVLWPGIDIDDIGNYS